MSNKPTTEGAPREEWEVLPYEGDGIFALWISRGYWSHGHPDLKIAPKFHPSEPQLHLSNQSDSCETIDLDCIEDIERLISHLQRARVWLEEWKAKAS